MKPAHFYSFLLIFCFAVANAAKSGNAPVSDFIAAINHHDTAKIALLVTDDHCFVDAIGQQIKGKDKVLSAWTVYLQWFPDYTIEVEQLMRNGDTVAIFGYASGTFYQLKGDTTKAHWHLPACWRAVVNQGKISLWQVYTDTKIPFEIISKYGDAQADSKVQGFGGVFFKSEKPKELAAWYDKHLGTSFGQQGFSVFWWRDYDSKQAGSTTFAIFKQTSGYFDPSTKPFMFNFRVTDLEAALSRLRAEGVTVVGDVQTFDYGKFGWILDADGNKIELWEPKDEENQFGKK